LLPLIPAPGLLVQLGLVGDPEEGRLGERPAYSSKTMSRSIAAVAMMVLPLPLGAERETAWLSPPAASPDACLKITCRSDRPSRPGGADVVLAERVE
jgi:hypothetical protein